MRASLTEIGKWREFKSSVPRLSQKLKALSSTSHGRCLVHGDFVCQNVAQPADLGGSYVIFDWANACVGHFLLDVIPFMEDVGIKPDSSEASHILNAWNRFGTVEELKNDWWAADMTSHLISASHYVDLLRHRTGASRVDLIGKLSDTVGVLHCAVEEKFHSS